MDFIETKDLLFKEKNQRTLSKNKRKIKQSYNGKLR